MNQGKNEIPLEIDTSQFAPDSYYMDIILIEYTEGNQYRHDLINRIVVFEIEETQYYYNLPWRTHAWGNVILNPVRIDEMPEHQE